MFRQIFASVVVIACMSAQGAAIQLQSSAAISTQATTGAFVSAEANETDEEAKKNYYDDEMDAVEEEMAAKRSAKADAKAYEEWKAEEMAAAMDE